MRRLATAACAAAVLACCGGLAHAQQGLADPGQIELISGAVLKGKLIERFWLPQNKEGQADGIILERPDGIRLWVPARYFSAGQWYWLTYYYYHQPAGHEFFAPIDEKVTAKLQYEVLAQRALESGLWDRARIHFEASVELARGEGGDPLATQYQNAYVEQIKKFGWWIHPADGRWVTEDEHWTAKGYRKWEKEWVTQEEYDKRKREAEEAAQREISIDPAPYRRVSLALVRAFPGDFAPRKDPWRIRFYGKLVAPPEEKFPDAGKYKPGDWRRIRTLSDDCADIYIEKTKKALLDKLAKVAPGNPVIVFGRLTVIEGRLLIEADEVVLR